MPRDLLRQPLKKSKYGNTITTCLSKHDHDSKGEAGYCDRLLADKLKKKILDYNIQVSFDLVVNKELICRHVVDFVVWQLGQRNCGEVHEYKGLSTATWVIKRKLFKALFPEVKYITVRKASKKDGRRSRSPA